MVVLNLYLLHPELMFPHIYGLIVAIDDLRSVGEDALLLVRSWQPEGYGIATVEDRMGKDPLGLVP